MQADRPQPVKVYGRSEGRSNLMQMKVNVILWLATSSNVF